MIQHPTSLSCPVMRRVLSHLLGRRASFTVPSSTVPTIDNPGADGVNTVQRGCATCDPTPGFRPTRRMSRMPVSTDRSPISLNTGRDEPIADAPESWNGKVQPAVDAAEFPSVESFLMATMTFPEALRRLKEKKLQVHVVVVVDVSTSFASNARFASMARSAQP